MAKILAAMPADAKPEAKTDPQAVCLPQSLDRLVPPLMEKYRVPGVSIVGIEDRRIAWERQYGVRCAGKPELVDNQTLFEACSMSKPPAAYVALKLVEEGKLDLDRPLAEYLDKPYLPDEPLHLKITARMVLTHTTGFPNWRDGGWRGSKPLSVLREPGTKYGYSGEGFWYLQQVIEHITGEPFNAYIKRTLFAPLGITASSYRWEDGFENRSAAGHDGDGKEKPNRPLYDRANAAFSLYCTPMEYAMFLVEMMNPDRSGAQSLSAPSLNAMLTRNTKIEGANPVARQGVPPAEPPYYGLGWVIDRTTEGDRISHAGANGSGFRCYCEFNPRRGNGIVIMTNSLTGDKLWREVIAKISKP